MDYKKGYEQLKVKADQLPQNYTPDSYAKELMKDVESHGNIYYSTTSRQSEVSSYKKAN